MDYTEYNIIFQFIFKTTTSLIQWLEIISRFKLTIAAVISFCFFFYKGRGFFSISGYLGFGFCFFIFIKGDPPCMYQATCGYLASDIL